MNFGWILVSCNDTIGSMRSAMDLKVHEFQFAECLDEVLDFFISCSISLYMIGV